MYDYFYVLMFSLYILYYVCTIINTLFTYRVNTIHTNKWMKIITVIPALPNPAVFCSLPTRGGPQGDGGVVPPYTGSMGHS